MKYPVDKKVRLERYELLRQHLGQSLKAPATNEDEKLKEYDAIMVAGHKRLEASFSEAELGFITEMNEKGIWKPGTDFLVHATGTSELRKKWKVDWKNVSNKITSLNEVDLVVLKDYLEMKLAE